MAPQQAQLHVVTNNSTKYEHILSWFQRSCVHKILLCHTVHSFKVTQLQILSNQIKYEQIPLYGFRGVAFTKCHGQTEIIIMSLCWGSIRGQKYTGNRQY